MERSVADAFRLLAEDTRIAILRAVARAQRDADRGSSTGFSIPASWPDLVGCYHG